MKKLVTVKQLVTALALAMVAASPAFAKTHHSESSDDAAVAADPYTVIAYDQVVGRDPDPNIRFQLMRDPGLLAN
jgi:hypothetical protein